MWKVSSSSDVYDHDVRLQVVVAALLTRLLTGHRRNLPATTIASFVLLSSLGSLGYALSLFFVTILYTPISAHKDGEPMHDALFTPLPIVYDLGIVISILSLNLFPELVSDFGDIRVMRFGYLAMPLFFAFAPQVCHGCNL